jgi:hypothetical protein
MSSDDAVNQRDPRLGYGRRKRRPFGGWGDWWGMICLTVAMLVVAAACAAFVFGFILLKLPMVLVIVALGQGILVGIGMRLYYRRIRLRVNSLAVVMGLAAGLISAMLVYVGLYVREVFAIQMSGSTSFVSAVLGMAGIGQANAFRAMSVVVTRPLTGHGGFLGYMLLRGLDSPHFLNAFGIHVVVTMLLAWRVSRGQVRRPFCEVCGDWTAKPQNAAVLPATYSSQLVEAVRESDSEKVVRLSREAAGVDLGRACAVARLHRCDCGHVMADVLLKRFERHATADEVLLAAQPIASTFAEALRSEPVSL